MIIPLASLLSQYVHLLPTTLVSVGASTMTHVCLQVSSLNSFCMASHQCGQSGLLWASHSLCGSVLAGMDANMAWSSAISASLGILVVELLCTLHGITHQFSME